MKKRMGMAGLALAALLLELLPWGVQMRFMAPPGEEPFFTQTSYFDLTPFGYGNFAPLLTALLTCVLAAATLLYAVTARPGWGSTAKYAAAAAAIASVCPVLFGAYTLIGGMISMVLFGLTVCLFRTAK